ncbi:MAG: hypothetical protein A3G32_10020 [Deltaproteobacteria bacterium RIFCSPLOWO2_12_FULL_40_28]|nr:MAG: hypothetical protein A3C45_05030 [Deltaproteobacteria bacterium RIFCSPHIGHO2_02_FULL_40_28]OGQ20366.1 MAG: hypothetical protein A3E27_00410 [Deltaproteobacteria bacterium RIFCSPHIGHO2_12_FULL_40_32]OGQ41335.1 MAG: hypothetical protein A3I69_02060 [Deltaproteobacteria bacterium RIFCSPLOWO2_02_FULL_40_36]OGQ54974.1 MAG: hypothetical protein A3G32_10020 [Deltaproteobacteria bacterium RIFCSPLOWO2_12_FULL_40_28]
MTQIFHHPQIDPIFKQGNNGAGVLVLHGFTGTPDSMRPLINYLNQKNFTVSAPLLEGHGQTPEQCAKTNWQDWFSSVQKAYMELHQKCSRIFVCGLSLGSLLTLKLAEEYPQSISGIACLATPLYFKPWIQATIQLVKHTPLKNLWRFQKKYEVDIKDPQAKKNFWNYDLMPTSSIVSIADLQNVIRPQLASIHMPLLVIHSRHDNTATYGSMAKVASSVSSAITETITLENSYHIITLDYDKDLVAEKVTSFFERFL